MKYSEEIIDHAKHPHNYGGMSAASCSAKDGNASCGDVVEIFLKLDGEVIEEAKWKGQGCAMMTASASMFTDEIIGKKVSEVLNRDDKEWVEEVVGEVNPGRLKCCLLPVEVVKEALLGK